MSDNEKRLNKLITDADKLFERALQIQIGGFASVEAKQSAISIWFMEIKKWRKDVANDK